MPGGVGGAAPRGVPLSRSSARRYCTREQILIRNHYDPNVDIVRRRDGLIELAGKKPRLRDDTSAYFAERNEGTVDFYP